jgi:hypothetical protein
MVDFAAPAAAARDAAVVLLVPVAVAAGILPAVVLRCYRELRAPGPLELARQHGGRPGSGRSVSSPQPQPMGGGDLGPGRLLARMP